MILFYSTFLLSLLMAVFYQFFTMQLVQVLPSAAAFGAVSLVIRLGADVVHLALAITAVWLLPGAFQRRQWIATAMIAAGTLLSAVYGILSGPLFGVLAPTTDPEVFVRISGMLSALVAFAGSCLLLLAWLLVRDRTRPAHIVAVACLLLFLLLRLLMAWTLGPGTASAALRMAGAVLGVLIPGLTAAVLGVSELVGRRRGTGSAAPDFPASGRSPMPGHGVGPQ
ncbi:hypothetical protein GCM10009823_13100 [Brevibacterium salitolerans]|uniref:Uncharacterized protein n=1 Tax=Brevibacterium salitolerans TaxID=1403566 RepID=A0ABN2WLC7_9MICO